MSVQKYKMSLTLNVLNHLGINLYSNVPAVLSEVVANSWDADASEVNIDIKDKSITIKDDGDGMDEEDINGKYLAVGYKKRDDIKITKKHDRPVMGRKGIGKLSLFSIADTIEIHTVKDGNKCGFRMDGKEIQSKIKQNTVTPYYPEQIEDPDIKRSENGTTIILTDLKKRISNLETYLRRRLARRFSIIGSDTFDVQINGEPITVTDRGYFDKMRYLWHFGKEGSKYIDLCKLDKTEFAERINGSVPIKGGTQESVTGWIGTVQKLGDLTDKDGDENLNKIVIMVRGKLAQEDILEDFREGGLYTKYLIGEIHADFLDQNEEPDIATSNRQEIIKDDPRYKALRKWVNDALKQIETQWIKRRKKAGVNEAREIPAIAKWLDNLKGERKQHAQSLLGKIGQLALDDDQRVDLYKYCVLAFENLKYKERISELENLTPEDIGKVGELFTNLADIEAYRYYQIFDERLKIIEALERMIKNNDLEREIQDYLYENFWLLDPSWDRVSDLLEMEHKITNDLKGIPDIFTNEELCGRIDIKYKKMAGRHVIIELKRPNVTINSSDLLDQVTKYRTALQKHLDLIGDKDDTIEIVCIVGKKPRQWTDAIERKRWEDIFARADTRFVFYKELINNARQVYKEFLKAKEEAGRICEIIKDIDIQTDIIT